MQNVEERENGKVIPLTQEEEEKGQEQEQEQEQEEQEQEEKLADQDDESKENEEVEQVERESNKEIDEAQGVSEEQNREKEKQEEEQELENKSGTSTLPCMILELQKEFFVLFQEFEAVDAEDVLFYGDRTIFSSTLSDFIKSLKQVFEINNDVTLEFPQLELSIPQDLSHAKVSFPLFFLFFFFKRSFFRNFKIKNKKASQASNLFHVSWGPANIQRNPCQRIRAPKGGNVCSQQQLCSAVQ